MAKRRMIGQAELMEKFSSYTFLTLPQSLLIEGEFGSGKHLFVSMLADRYSVETENITENLNYEYLSSLFLRVMPMIYVVDSALLSQKDQNALLKFLEEPASNSKVIILCENKSSLLETIQSRCFQVKFKPYTFEDLSHFTDDSTILAYASTPGQVIELQRVGIDQIVQLCNTILDNIDSASIPNILTLSNKFNFGKNPEKMDIGLFSRILVRKTLDRVVSDSRFYSAYNVVNSLYNKLGIPGIDKKKLFESKLLDLKFALK